MICKSHTFKGYLTCIVLQIKWYIRHSCMGSSFYLFRQKVKLLLWSKTVTFILMRRPLKWRKKVMVNWLFLFFGKKWTPFWHKHQLGETRSCFLGNKFCLVDVIPLVSHTIVYCGPVFVRRIFSLAFSTRLPRWWTTITLAES